LRRHVTHRAHHHARICIDTTSGNIGLRLVAIKLRELRQTKVENLYAAIVSDEDVVGFQIAMDDSLLVCCCQTVGDLERVVDCASLAQLSATDALSQR